MQSLQIAQTVLGNVQTFDVAQIADRIQDLDVIAAKIQRFQVLRIFQSLQRGNTCIAHRQIAQLQQFFFRDLFFRYAQGTGDDLAQHIIFYEHKTVPPSHQFSILIIL